MKALKVINKREDEDIVYRHPARQLFNPNYNKTCRVFDKLKKYARA